MNGGEAYLASISVLGLDRLNAEPQRLRNEAASVSQAVGRLALQNYRVFIANHDCVRALRTQSKTFNEATSSLRSELSAFVHDTASFRTEAEKIIAAHKRNRMTLEQHMTILDLLELPQIMDACVRNGLTEGALDIANFANTLERRHTRRPVRGSVPAEGGVLGGSRVIMGVVGEIRASMVVLRSNLLRKLSLGPIQLPQCLAMVSNLRRLDSMVLEKQPFAAGSAEEIRHLALALELKLQTDFLAARSAWLESELRGVESVGLKGASPRLGSPLSDAEPFQCLLDVVETSRTLWFEIGTQFRAIFSSGSSSGSSECGPDSSSEVLSSWLVGKIEGFVALLRQALPHVKDGAALHDVLEQVMFLGASLGRLGADFRPLVVPILEDAVTSLVVSRWAAAESDLSLALSSGEDAALPLYLPSAHQGDGLGDQAEQASLEANAIRNDGSKETSDPPEPPHSTLAFPALAHAVNLYLESFNHLRLCAARSLRPKLELRFETSMGRMAKLLARHTEQVAGRPDDAEVAALLWREAGGNAFPHLCASLAFVFGGGDESSSGLTMAARLKEKLYDAFASQGLALARPKKSPPKPTPEAAQVPEATPASEPAQAAEQTPAEASPSVQGAGSSGVPEPAAEPAPEPAAEPAAEPATEPGAEPGASDKSEVHPGTEETINEEEDDELDEL